MEGARLYLYRMPEDTFTQDHDVAGYWVSHVSVQPLEMLTLDDLVARHVAADIPLRREVNLWPLWIRSSRRHLSTAAFGSGTRSHVRKQ